MESKLGQDDDVDNINLKLVPWINWDDWKLVKTNLFSSSPNSISSALRRISAWRCRGCTPVPVVISASIIEIQLKDPVFRNDLEEFALQSDELLAMLYSMAIIRLVNEVIEKTRQKNKVSIGAAADAIGMPRMLIDIRHEASHRDLPSLKLVRLGSEKALEWLISYYWEPQEMAIPVQNNQTANLNKEIKHRLREVNLCLKAKQSESTSSHAKIKRSKQTEHLFGRNKFLYPVAVKLPGYKKQLNKSLKNVLRLYSSFSPEVVYVLLEFLLNSLDSSSATEHDNLQIGQSTEKKQTVYEDWKSVVLKLSRKEPDLLLSLTQAVLEKMEPKNGIHDDCQFPMNSTEHRRIALLPVLLEWLTRNLKPSSLVSQNESAESKEKHLSDETLRGLLRRCLLLSSSRNKQLMVSILILAQQTGDTSLLQKLKKLTFLELSINESSPVSSGKVIILSNQETSIHEAEKKLEFIRRCRLQGRKVKPRDSSMGSKSRWSITKSLNSCPIGMLTSSVGFSGGLPVLDFPEECREVVKLSDSEQHCEQNECRKRGAESSVMNLDHPSPKKMLIREDCESYDEGDTITEGVKGHLMIDGVWRKVGEEDVRAIASDVRIWDVANF